MSNAQPHSTKNHEMGSDAFFLGGPRRETSNPTPHKETNSQPRNKKAFDEALRERILLSNKNFDVKKVSKSIVVYHQMKNSINQSREPHSLSRYKNAMMLSAEDNMFDSAQYRVNEDTRASQVGDGLALALEDQQLKVYDNNEEKDLDQYYLRKMKINNINKNGSANTAATSG